MGWALNWLLFMFELQALSTNSVLCFLIDEYTSAEITFW